MGAWKIKNAYIILVATRKGKRKFGRAPSIWEENTKMESDTIDW